jgi:hypothetical protein
LIQDGVLYVRVQERICAARVGATMYCGASCCELIQDGVLYVRVQERTCAARVDAIVYCGASCCELIQDGVLCVCKNGFVQHEWVRLCTVVQVAVS